MCELKFSEAPNLARSELVLKGKRKKAHRTAELKAISPNGDTVEVFDEMVCKLSALFSEKLLTYY